MYIAPTTPHTQEQDTKTQFAGPVFGLVAKATYDKTETAPRLIPTNDKAVLISVGLKIPIEICKEASVFIVVSSEKGNVDSVHCVLSYAAPIVLNMEYQ